MSDVTEIKTLMEERAQIDVEILEKKQRKEAINARLAELVSGKKKKS